MSIRARSTTQPRPAALEAGSGSLADLIADARAIPAAAFGVSRSATQRVIDLTEPARRAVLVIPETTAAFIEHAEHAFADYLR